jgi:hypothetical protein
MVLCLLTFALFVFALLLRYLCASRLSRRFTSLHNNSKATAQTQWRVKQNTSFNQAKLAHLQHLLNRTAAPTLT